MLRVLVVGALLSACSGGSDVESQPVATTRKAAASGTVVEVTGNVTATNAGTVRPLAVGNPVANDDVIETQKDGSIVIELFHNNVRWSLEGGIKTRVDESVAWGVPKQEVAKAVDHPTSAAGRHADRLAADTAVTATEKNVTPPQPIPPKTTSAGSGSGPGQLQKPGRGGDDGQMAKPDPKPVTEQPVPRRDRPKEPRTKQPTDSKQPGPPAEKPENRDLPESPGRTDITNAMQQLKPRIMACGEKHGVKGIIKLAIKIAPDGTASNVTVKQTPDQKVDACVIDVVKPIRLPKSTTGVTFTYPIIL